MSFPNKQILYTTPPNPSINPSLDPNSPGTFSLHTTTTTKPAENAPNLVVRTHYLSLDPAMRQWLTAKRSYIAPVSLNAVMRGQSIAQVISVPSGLSGQFHVGQWVIAMSGWQEYATVRPKDVSVLPDRLPAGCTPRDALSVLGTTGLTAYFGITGVLAPPRAGETVVVSGAAGATGMVAGQIAKILGARVIGVAGTASKCGFLTNELGFDAAVNYRDADWKTQLKTATPGYVDFMFDNVGGEVLDACLGRAARDARFVICGAISQYNSARPEGPRSFMTVIVSFLLPGRWMR